MIHTQDADFTLICADVLDGLRSLEDGSVHCVVTSPPYWGLRDYGTGGWTGGIQEGTAVDCPDCSTREEQLRCKTCLKTGEILHRHDRQIARNGRGGSGAPGKQTEGAFPSVYAAAECSCGATRVDQQLGLEATPDLYVARMVEVFREVWRVLRADGTCWVNLGDSYAGSWGAQSRDEVPDGISANQVAAHPKRTNTGSIPAGSALKPKDLVGIPWRVAFALQADGWYLRSDIIWSKPNPMPESVTDRPTKAHEYVFLLSKGARYFFDQEAVREAHVTADDPRNRNGYEPDRGAWVGGGINDGRTRTSGASTWPAAGRNVRSVWEIATQPYPEAHFATYPEELVRRCVLAGTSERGCCPVCGKPWEREVERTTMVVAPSAKGDARREQGLRTTMSGTMTVAPTATTLGWRPSCYCQGTSPDGLDHHPPIPCTVLDPFLGSGTTAHVARKHGRRSIGIELNPAYCDLAARRMQQQSLFAVSGAEKDTA